MATETKTPEVLSSEKIYAGRVFDVTVDTIREGSITYKREIVHHPGSAVIIPVYDDGTVALVRQYRHPAGRFLLEAPAGSLAPAEQPRDGAVRELEEEIGVVAEKVELLVEFFVSPGFLKEKMWLYLATGLANTAKRPDDDEVIEIVRVTFKEAFEMIERREIEDAKTIVGLMLAGPRLGVYASGANYPAV